MDVNHGRMVKKVVIREYDGGRDLEMVEKLERNCEIGSRGGISILTNMMGDPLCRIRLYPLYVMLVAELVGVGEIVGVVRGCMKCVGTGLGAGNVWIGCILGLRVSPKQRRIGIGMKLTESVEAWAVQNGAQHILLATEESNIASINLFVLKCHYMRLSSLAILVQPIDAHSKKIVSSSVKIEKLSIDQAALVYKDRLVGEKLFPADINAILNEQLSLGTWVSYFKEEEWNKDGEFLTSAPRSWAIMSMWKTYESYKLQLRCTPSVRCFHATLKQIGHNVLPCLRLPFACELPRRPFGFLFIYGIHGEGERLSDLLKYLWYFAFNSARDIKDCKAIVSEVSYSDPLFAHMPSTSCIKDLWFMKRVGSAAMKDDKDLDTMRPSMHSFVDPRDF